MKYNGNALFKRRHGYRYPLIVKGEGPYLFDSDGKRYLDAIGGAGVACLGHGLREIVEEIGPVLSETGYLHGMQFRSRELEEYSEFLISRAPKPLSKVQFMSSGSEATEAALKLAYQFQFAKYGNHKRTKFIYNAPSYHGSTGLALSVTGKKRDQAFFPGLILSSLQTPCVPMAHCERCPYGLNPESCNFYCTDQLERAILEAGPDCIAALVIEPYGGASSGASLLAEGYLKRAKSICDRYGILTIFDEVMCGNGRTGKLFACDHHGVSPDILTTGKSLAAGLFPLSAIFCTNEIYDTVIGAHGGFKHGHTFTNHHLAVAAALSVSKYIERHKLLENVARNSEELISKLYRLKDRYPIIGDVRGKGFLIGIELRDPSKPGSTPFPRSMQISEKVVTEAMNLGLNLYFSIEYQPGDVGDAVMLMPPYNFSLDHIEETIDLLSKTFDNLALS